MQEKTANMARSEDYVRANWFLTRLRDGLHLRKITQPQFHRLRMQALNGGLDRAEQEFERSIREARA